MKNFLTLSLLVLAITPVTFANTVIPGERLLKVKTVHASVCTKMETTSVPRNSNNLGSSRSIWVFYMTSANVKQTWLTSGGQIVPDSIHVIESVLAPREVVTVAESRTGNRGVDVRTAETNAKKLCETKRTAYLAEMENESPTSSVNSSERSERKDLQEILPATRRGSSVQNG